MTYKEILQFAYGMFMGTSMPFLKPAKRFLYPAYRLDSDGRLGIFLGGSGICAVLYEGAEALIINANQGASAEEFRSWCADKGVDFPRSQLVLSSTSPDFAGGLEVFRDVGRLIVGAVPARQAKRELGASLDRAEVLREERVMRVAGESVRLIPMPAGQIAIFLETRSILFTGPLVYNRVHPPLHPERAGFAPEEWIATTRALLERLKPRQVVPGEGDLMDVAGAFEFLKYLEDLMDPAVEFSFCRANYDWAEIPRHTSLEENFELLRSRKKTFTSLNH